MIETITETVTKQAASGKAIAFEIGGQRYRLRRYNSMNLVIERENDKCHPWATADADGWSVYGYFGNSLPSLANGLAQVATEAHTPNAADLTAQAEALRRDFAEGVGRITAALKGAVTL